MGAWGEGIYDDDEACDVRNMIRLLSKAPVSGDRILEILLSEFKRNEELKEDGCPTFWIAVADQFEKKGICCKKAFEQAKKAIKTGADIEDLRNRGMEKKALENRLRLTNNLLQRFQTPTQKNQASITRKPIQNCVKAGQIYTFPTMDGSGFNAWAPNWMKDTFQPNGWGALIIIEVGQVFDWFPYCAYTPLVVCPDRKMSFDEVLKSKTLFSDGVAYCLPQHSHMKKMGMELLGCIEIDKRQADKITKLSDRSPRQAVICEWSICNGAMGATEKHKGYFEVKELQKKS
ncbi:MAG: hypothetical protein Q7U02_10850 [Desulfosalsimonadaceae bacterium]|nr:hypothetical protein [Desulfosalsimonadaceae bacterium]